MILRDTYKNNDELYEHLGSLGFDGSIDDRIFKYLRSEGYTGAISDMAKALIQAGDTPVVERPENLLSDPTDLSGAAWTANAMTVDGNTITADGTNSVHRVRQWTTTTVGTDYILEADVQNIDAIAIGLVLTASSIAESYTSVVYDPSTWTISQSQSGLNSVDWGDPDPARSVTDLGGGNYRLRLAGRSSGADYDMAAIVILDRTTGNNLKQFDTGFTTQTATGSIVVNEMHLHVRP